MVYIICLVRVLCSGCADSVLCYWTVQYSHCTTPHTHHTHTHTPTGLILKQNKTADAMEGNDVNQNGMHGLPLLDWLTCGDVLQEVRDADADAVADAATNVVSAIFEFKEQGVPKSSAASARTAKAMRIVADKLAGGASRLVDDPASVFPDLDAASLRQHLAAVGLVGIINSSTRRVYERKYGKEEKTHIIIITRWYDSRVPIMCVEYPPKNTEKATPLPHATHLLSIFLWLTSGIYIHIHIHIHIYTYIYIYYLQILFVRANGASVLEEHD